MNKLDQPKGKHNHKWTDILKVCIFSILMIAPFIAILSKIIYVSANKNAKDSYYGETINEEQEERILLQYYKNDVNYTIYSNVDILITSGNVDIYTNKVIYDNNIVYEDVDRIRLYTSNNGTMAVYYTNDTPTSYQTGLFTNRHIIQLDIIRYINNSMVGNVYLNYIIYNQYSYLDNVFYYAVDQMKNDQLFKWVDTTIVYNGLNAMNSGFGLPSNHALTYLLAYWTILTAIYIVIDIILFLFTKLTHLLQ